MPAGTLETVPLPTNGVGLSEREEVTVVEALPVEPLETVSLITDEEVELSERKEVTT